MRKKDLESKIETYLKDQIRAIGGLCYKFKSTVNGVPDQLIIFNGGMYLVEVKRPGEKPRANQINVHKQINQQGVPVYNVDSTEVIDDFLRDILKQEPIHKIKNTAEIAIKSTEMFKI